MHRNRLINGGWKTLPPGLILSEEAGIVSPETRGELQALQPLPSREDQVPLRRRATVATTPKPASNMAQLSGSGTDGTGATRG